MGIKANNIILFSAVIASAIAANPSVMAMDKVGVDMQYAAYHTDFPVKAPAQVQYGYINFDEVNQADQLKEKEQVIEGATIYSYRFGTDERKRLSKAGVKIGRGSKNGYMELEEGNVLLNPSSDIVVDTKHGKIMIERGATLFVMMSGDDLAIYDFAQSAPKAVSIVLSDSNESRIGIDSGQVILFSKKNTTELADFDINCMAIASTNIRSIDLGNKNLKTYVGNFSVTSAIMIVAPLKRMALSRYKYDNLAMEKLVKSAVTIQDPGDPASTAIYQLSN